MKTIPFKPSQDTLKEAKLRSNPSYSMDFSDKTIEWKSNAERVELIREGLPFDAIEKVAITYKMPVKNVLMVMDIPQTTYNKKKKDQEKLSGRDSELILVLSELMDLGVDTFNGEVNDFLAWLKKPNISLGGVSPESLFDSVTGIEEVRNCLHRIEYGNLA
ncbi:type II RES/Xre toxin-antitoxin system antitoxin [Mongoliitalea lutea]|nr:antitoxin Xre/MbcA/ParS toxin-binding domain-containing protein [Mongoliitalea lutea]